METIAQVVEALDALASALARMTEERDDWKAHVAGEQETAGNARLLQKQAEAERDALREAARALVDAARPAFRGTPYRKALENVAALLPPSETGEKG